MEHNGDVAPKSFCVRLQIQPNHKRLITCAHFKALWKVIKMLVETADIRVRFQNPEFQRDSKLLDIIQ